MYGGESPNVHHLVNKQIVAYAYTGILLSNELLIHVTIHTQKLYI